MNNTGLTWFVIPLITLCLAARPSAADSSNIWYGGAASYLVDALVRKPPSDCKPPFRPWGARGLTLAIAVRNDTTLETLNIEMTPLFSLGTTTLELTRPIVFGRINLERRRVTLRLPTLLEFFTGTYEYFVTAQGAIANQLDLIITLERITPDPHQQFCPMIYHVTGNRLPEGSGP